jgi:hypothetical protein
MGYGKFKLNDIPIKNPTSFGIENYTLTKSTRVANGDMVMDFVANKLKFTFGYEAIDSRDFNTILDIVWRQLAITRKCFVTLSYYEDGSDEQKTATVYAGALPRKLHRGDGKNWVWKDVSFSLIER